MKQKSYWLLLVATVALFFFAGWNTYAQKETPSATSSRVVWEYKTLRADRALTEATLNDMGMYGWELILFDDGERGNGSYGGTYYFKRPK